MESDCYRKVLSAALLLCGFCAPAAALGRDLWVSVRGNDANDGDARRPVATVEAALARDPTGHILVTAGTYQVSRTLLLGAANAGAVIEAAGVGETIISGETRISRFEEVKPGVWRGRPGFRISRLWVNGKSASVATVPARYWHYITENVAGEVGRAEEKRDLPGSRAFHPEPPDMAILAQLGRQELAEVVVALWHSWEVSKHRISAVDTRSNLVYLASEPPWPFFSFGDVQRYQLENVPGSLNIGGQWYQSADNLLYYRPRADEDMRRAVVVASNLAPLLKIENTRGITLRGLQFQFTAADLDPILDGPYQAASHVGAALVVDNSQDIRLTSLAVVHTGGYGVWFRHNCRDSALTRSLLEDLGAGGVRVGETAAIPAAEKTTRGIVVDDNIIRGGGHLFPPGVGILVGHADGNRLSRNEIADFLYSGISVGWVWKYGTSLAVQNVIEGNHIHDIGQEQLGDLAGIYTLGESPGTIVRGNLIHDINAYPGDRAGAWGLYADAASSGIVFERNLVYRTTSGGFHLHYGRDNLVRKNVFALGKRAQLQLSKSEPHQSVTFVENAIITDGAPILAGAWRDAIMTMDGNMYFNIGGGSLSWLGLGFGDWQSLGVDRRSVVTDPGFVNAGVGDFRLRGNAKWSWDGQSPVDGSGVYGSVEWRMRARSERVLNVGEVPIEPAPRPLLLKEDFESSPVGSTPSLATVITEGKDDLIRVNNEQAKSGTHSLKFQNAVGLRFAYNPHMFYRPHHRSGSTSVEFSYRGDATACVQHEWRDSATPYHVGPSLTIKEGRLWVNGQSLAVIPSEEWVTVKIDAGLGTGSTGAWRLELSLGDGATVTRSYRDSDPGWRELEWLGFFSACASHGISYIDDIQIQNR